MKKKIAFFVFLIFCISTSCKSQNWAYVGLNEQGEKTYINTKNIIQVSSNIKKAWTKFSKRDYKFYENGTYRIIPLITYTYLAEYDCFNKTTKNISLIVREESNGRILFNETKEKREQKIEYMVPDTIGEAIITYLCK